MRLVFLGPPGAGKGTQAKRLASDLAVPHLSTGDMFRSAIAGGTEVGLAAKRFMDEGRLVPDEVVDALVAERLGRQDAAGGFVLDGYPRTLHQAGALEGLSPLDQVLCLDLPTDELKRRILARGEGRKDDTEAVVEERLRVYEAETAPLIEYYRERSLLRRIDGLGSIDEVFARVKTGVESQA